MQCSISGSVGSVRFWASMIRIRFRNNIYGSRSLHQQAKKFRKTLISTVIQILMTFYLWRLILMYLQKVISKKHFLLASRKPLTKKRRVRVRIRTCNAVSGSKDPDPSQNVLDAEHYPGGNWQLETEERKWPDSWRRAAWWTPCPPR